jgi:acyl carrier protein
MDRIREQIRSFLNENFYLAGPIADDASLIEQGVIDSTGVLELIAFVEREFEIAVEDSEVHPDYFDSIERLSAFVQRKSQPPPS